MRLCVALLAVLAISASASGNAQVWFVANGEGGPGEVPKIDLPLSGGTVHIETWISVDGNGTFGYALAFDEVDLGSPGSFANPQYHGIAGWTTDYAEMPHPWGYADLMLNQSQTTAPWTGTAMVLEFDIVKEPGSGENMVVGGPGIYWTWGQGGATVEFGNGGQRAEGYYYQDNPMVIINKVPEPATIALLGFGALTLIRRRR